MNTTKAKKEILGFVEIDGKLVNIGSKTRKDFIMTVLLYDSVNHTIGSDDGVPNITTLAPGDASPFFVTIGGKDALGGINTKAGLRKIDHIVYTISVS